MNMPDVQDELLSGEAVYRLIDSNNNVIADNIKIEMITPVLQQPTAQNKAFYDKIKQDLTDLYTNKLDVSLKASQSEAETGTNNTKYMTPLRVAQSKIGNRIHISTGVVYDGDTIPQTSGYTNYFYFVSPTMDFYTSTTDSNEIFGAGFKIECFVNQTSRQVTSKAYFEVRKSSSSWSTISDSIKANYIEIAWN